MCVDKINEMKNSLGGMLMGEIEDVMDLLVVILL